MGTAIVRTSAENFNGGLTEQFVIAAGAKGAEDPRFLFGECLPGVLRGSMSDAAELFLGKLGEGTLDVLLLLQMRGEHDVQALRSPSRDEFRQNLVQTRLCRHNAKQTKI